MSRKIAILLLAVYATVIPGVAKSRIETQAGLPSQSSTDPVNRQALMAIGGKILQASDPAQQNKLIVEFFTLAEAKHLGNDPAFVMALSFARLAPNVETTLAYYQWAMRISERDHGSDVLKAVCFQLASISDPTWMAVGSDPKPVDDVEQRNPACRSPLEAARPKLNDQSLPDLYMKILRTQDLTERNRLIAQFLNVADARHLGADPAFAGSVSFVATDPDAKVRLGYLARPAGIAGRDHGLDVLKVLCGQIVGMVDPEWQLPGSDPKAFQAVENEYPGCNATLEAERPKFGDQALRDLATKIRSTRNMAERETLVGEFLKRADEEHLGADPSFVSVAAINSDYQKPNLELLARVAQIADRDQATQLRDSMCRRIADISNPRWKLMTADPKETQAVEQRYPACRIFLEAQRPKFNDQSLTDLMTKATQTNDYEERSQLIDRFLNLADSNHLGADPSFSRMMFMLSKLNPDEMRSVSERSLRIAVRDGGAKSVNAVCAALVRINLTQSMVGASAQSGGFSASLDNLQKQYPPCSAAVAHMQLNTQEIHRMDMVAKGDAGSLLASLKDRLERNQRSDTANFRALTYLSLMTGDINGARKYVLSLENELGTAEDRSLPGLPELDNSRGAENRTVSVISLAAFYHLKMAPDDAEIRANALQMILSGKSREADSARENIHRLRTDRSTLQSPFDRLMKEYDDSSSEWFHAVMYPASVSPEEEREAIKRIRQLQDEISPYMVDRTDLGQSAPPPRVKAVQANLGSNDSLIEFAEVGWFAEGFGTKPITDLRTRVDVDAHYVAYILRHDGSIHGVDLGPTSSIDEMIDRYVKGMDAQELTGPWQADARKLYSTVWKPLIAYIPTQGHVYVAPDARLNLLSFDSMMDENDQFVINNWNITYLASGRQLAEANRTEARVDSVEVFADPDLTNGEDRHVQCRPDVKVSAAASGSRGLASTGLAGHFPNLPNTCVEAQMIARKLPNVSLHTDSEASKETFNGSQGSRAPSILHIATHGYYFRQPGVTQQVDPLNHTRDKEPYGFFRSGLILARPQKTEVEKSDGKPAKQMEDVSASTKLTRTQASYSIMTALEIGMLDLKQTNLVVLSACDSAQGDTTPGDNLSGMRSAFQIAGAHSLISSLWKLDDYTAEEMMESFYTNLLNSGKTTHESINDSLRAAKLKIMEEHPEPYYWASYVFNGQDQVLRF